MACVTSSDWSLRDCVLDLNQPRVMAILNLTPDSFSDGGQSMTKESALSKAHELVEAGADLLDIGAESTRPGAKPVHQKEEWQRLEPVLKSLVLDFKIPISVDTRNGETAHRSLELGVHVINDISCASDASILKQVKEYSAGYVLMHSRGTPETMNAKTQYDDLCTEIRREIRSALQRVRQAGIEFSKVVVDPGFGFAKTSQQNWTLLENLSQISEEGRPLLAGLSRKKMLREIVGEDPTSLMSANLAAAWIALVKGAKVLRVHDVKETVSLVKVWNSYQKRF